AHTARHEIATHEPLQSTLVWGLVEERLWHESQRLQWLPADDTLFEQAPDEPEALMATFRLANMVEFKQWIKGFGDQAEVLRPGWLRGEMRVELLAATRRYGE
ncbi:MAG: WYL domain-containing protein, partial [Phycisphaerae bacterium]